MISFWWVTEAVEEFLVRRAEKDEHYAVHFVMTYPRLLSSISGGAAHTIELNGKYPLDGSSGGVR